MKARDELWQKINEALEALHEKRNRLMDLVGVSIWEYSENRLHKGGVFAKTNPQNLVAFVVSEDVGRWMADNDPLITLKDIEKDIAVISAFKEILLDCNSPRAIDAMYHAMEAMLVKLHPFRTPAP